jgi:hypothetical protein
MGKKADLSCINTMRYNIQCIWMGGRIMSEFMWLVNRKCRTSLLRRPHIKYFQCNDMYDAKPQVQSDVV